MGCFGDHLRHPSLAPLGREEHRDNPHCSVANYRVRQSRIGPVGLLGGAMSRRPKRPRPDDPSFAYRHRRHRRNPDQGSAITLMTEARARVRLLLNRLWEEP
jgi:hypothetical protein